MLTITTWKWGAKYNAEYVRRLHGGLKRHLHQPHRFLVCAPEPEDEYLTKIPGCFCRLRMFDPAWQARHEIEGRILNLDLDLIITGNLDPIVAAIDAPFAILKGANAANPCPFNGSVFMTTVGYRPDVWTDFTVTAAARLPYHDFPDDQGWFWHKLPEAAGWQAGASSGIYAFQKPGWPKGNDLPNGAKIVCFPGRRDPSQFTRLPWVREYWR